MSLLKEFSRGDTQADLKTSDGSDAGSGDVANKPVDVRFSMMRNIINTDGGVNGSDVNDYLERAHELNDEVDTVGFAVETDDGDIIKIYVNATQADDFEQELSKLLGLDDDSEMAINTLAQKFDIIDVVWPQDPEADAAEMDGAEDPYAQTSIDDDPSSFMGDDETGSEEPSEPAQEPIGDGESDSEGGEVDELPDDALPADDDAEEDEDTEESAQRSLMKDIAGSSEEAPSDDDNTEDEGTAGSGEGPDEVDTEENAEGTGEDNGELDADGNPVKKEKKKAAPKDKEVTEEGLLLNKLAALVEGHQTEEEDMSIGTKFLHRLNEAEAGGVEVTDTVWKGLMTRLKRPYEKKIVEFFFLLGIPGRYIRGEEGIDDAIRAGADIIRRAGRKQTTFNALYDAVKTGLAQEALSVDDEAMLAEKKAGSRVQKILETALVALGFPEALVTTESGGALITVLRRAARNIEQSSTAEAALMGFAKALGLTTAQVNESPRSYVGARFLERVAEDIDVGQDDFAEGVMALVLALGIPEQIMTPRRAAIIKALREKKMTLNNRTMVEQRMAALVALIQKGTKPTAQGQVQEGVLAEAFKDLEAMDNTDLKRFSVEEPYAGPAMFAQFEGSSRHADTHIILAVDPDSEGGDTLFVSVMSPWAEKDQIKKAKHFPNDKQGYNLAKSYAENLRTLNPKTGGRPKGWKEETGKIKSVTRVPAMEGLIEEDAKVAAFKIKIDLSKFPGMKSSKIEDAIFGEEEGDGSWVQDQSVITIESVKLKGDTLYVYPMYDDHSEAMQSALQRSYNRWQSSYKA